MITSDSFSRHGSREIDTDRSCAKVAYFRGERHDAQWAAWKAFRRPVQTWQYAGLAGAPDDAQVEVGTLRGDLYIELHKPGIDGYRGIQLIRSVRSIPVLINEALCINRHTMRGRGLGVRIFRRQLIHADALGVKRIETVAGRGKHENGYYTWPRFGFDGLLPFGFRRNLPPEHADARSVLDLMDYGNGRLWWRENGIPIRLAFQVDGQSRSRLAFAQYIRGRSLGRPGILGE
jgi:hypothetical protein